MNTWEEFFDYIEIKQNEANRGVMDTALVNPPEYAMWFGISEGLKSITGSFRVNQIVAESAPSKIVDMRNLIEHYIEYYQKMKEDDENTRDRLAMTRGVSVTHESARKAIENIRDKFNEVNAIMKGGDIEEM